MSKHACKVDRSRETGSLVVCTCGFAVGPFMDHTRAIGVAREHRNAHAAKTPLDDEQRERHNAKRREQRAARHPASGLSG